MITIRPAYQFIAAALFCIFAGCASQTATVMDAPPEPNQSSVLDKSKPVPSNTEEEQEELLEDDWDDWDDLENEDESQEFATVADPLESFNRAMFKFNDKLYFWFLKPVSQGYRKITPQKLRIGLKNFFFNLAAPIRVVNCALQGKGTAAAAEFSSFVINSTFGVLGFGNLTKDYPELNPDPEDLGQTLGRYGIGDGFYVVWPILGPSTLRDTFGRAGDSFLDPVNMVDPIETSLAVRGCRTVNTVSFRIGDYESLKKAALDPYEATRNGYIQSRQTRIKK